MVFKKNQKSWNKGLTKEIDNRLNYDRPTSFKKGHKTWNKNIKRTKEEKNNISLGTKKGMKINRKNVLEGIEKRCNNPNWRNNCSIASKKVWDNPNMREKYMKGFENRDNVALGKSISKIRKKLFAQGKLKVWNKGYGDYIKGEKNPMYGKKHKERTKRKISAIRQGIKLEDWNKFISREPYGIEFDTKLKEQIRKRDNYRCQECFRHQDELITNTKVGIRKYKLHVHHIDFNKQNNNTINLISLCRSCHTQTQFNREDWTNYFQNKQ